MPESDSRSCLPAERAGAAPAWLIVAAQVFILGLGLQATAARAAMYVCNAAGRTITGDQPPVECRDVQIRELNPDGSVKRVIDPPLTPEQRKRKEQEEARAQQQEEEERAQHRRDRALLETYATEDEIVAARERALNSRQTLIDRAKVRLEEHRQDRVKLDNEAEFYARRNLPLQLKHAIEVNDDLQHKEEKIISDMEAETQRIGERFEVERQRFHELLRGGATPRNS